MRRLICLLLLFAFCSAPVVAFAQTEPYSSSTTSAACTPAIAVAASGLTGQFTATCVTAACTWDYGDTGAGEGNPVSHTYAADGEYNVTATCGDVVITGTFVFAAELAFTGFGLVPFGVAIAVLVLLGAGALWFSRRARSRS